MSKRVTPFPDIDPVEILDTLPIGVFLTDGDGNINWVNTTLCDQVGLPASDLVGRTRTALPAKKTLRLSNADNQYLVKAVQEREQWIYLLSIIQ